MFMLAQARLPTGVKNVYMGYLRQFRKAKTIRHLIYPAVCNYSKARLASLVFFLKGSGRNLMPRGRDINRLLGIKEWDAEQRQGIDAAIRHRRRRPAVTGRSGSGRHERA